MGKCLRSFRHRQRSGRKGAQSSHRYVWLSRVCAKLRGPLNAKLRWVAGNPILDAMKSWHWPSRGRKGGRGSIGQNLANTDVPLRARARVGPARLLGRAPALAFLSSPATLGYPISSGKSFSTTDSRLLLLLLDFPQTQSRPPGEGERSLYADKERQFAVLPAADAAASASPRL